MMVLLVIVVVIVVAIIVSSTFWTMLAGPKEHSFHQKVLNSVRRHIEFWYQAAVRVQEFRLIGLQTMKILHSSLQRSD